MPTWTSEQAASLAPDAASISAARGLANPRLWSSTGHDERTVWGRCRGYSSAVDIGEGGPAFSCTCPSRKVPCKHALGLLLLWASQPEHVSRSPAPVWVEEWLAARTQRAAQPRAADRRPVDPEARAKRMAGRTARIAAGLEELDLWLRDLVRQGLASAQARPFRYWDEMAARMVDAQAPGVGSQVRRMAGIVRSGDGWPGRLLLQAGRLHLTARAWGRFDTLAPETQADLRTVAGWSWTSEEVLAGPLLRDRWQVAARSVAEEERFRIVRTWLVGTATSRIALVLEFVAVHEPLPSVLTVGTEVEADLAFFPGAWPQRALVATLHGEPEPIAAWHGSATFEDALALYANALAANPWLDRLPLVVSDVVPLPRDGGWWVRDGAGAAVRLLLDEPAWWKMVAVSGGGPLGLAGEWQEGALRPLSAWAAGRLVPLP